MANKVYNLNGGLYSGDAFTAFETRIASSNNGSIVASPSDLKVSAGSGMNVSIATGAGIIGNGTLSGVRFAIDAPVTVAVNAASTANPRMDSVVAYIDKSVSASTSVVDNTDLGIVKFKSVAGTPASSPTAPSASTIQSSIGAGNPYMVLANIKVPKSSTAASSFTITDMRVTPTSAIITDSSITAKKLANKAVTSAKVDWATLTTFTQGDTSSKTLTTTSQILLQTPTLVPGKYIVFAKVGANVTGFNTDLGDLRASVDGGENVEQFTAHSAWNQAPLVINQYVSLTSSGTIKLTCWRGNSNGTIVATMSRCSIFTLRVA